MQKGVERLFCSTISKGGEGGGAEWEWVQGAKLWVETGSY